MLQRNKYKPQSAFCNDCMQAFFTRLAWIGVRIASMFFRIAAVASLLLVSPALAQEQAAPRPAYDQDTPIETLAADPAAAEILNKDLPGLLTDSQYPLFKRMSLKTIQRASGGDLSAADVDKTVADLQALPPR